MTADTSAAGTSDPGALQALASELRILVGRLRRRLREESRPGALTWSQTSVLGHLEREGAATVTALARAEGVRPQSMGATVAALEAAGMLVGAPDPADGRQTIFSVTPLCREWIQASRAARDDWLFHAISERFAPAEHEALARAVELLQRLVEP